MDITGELRLVRQATVGLLSDLRGVEGDALDGPSRLTGWTRRDVVAHLVADARARAGADDRSDEHGDVVGDLAAACEHLADTWAVRSPDSWGRRLDGMRRGNSRAASEPAARLTEVCLHHVDLDIGLEPSAWPEPVVEVCLDHAMAALARHHARVRGDAASWRLHRTDAEESSPSDWLVLRAPYGTEVHAMGGDADATIAGTGAALLAWITGRTGPGTADVVVTGDAELAASLPVIYPYEG